MLPVTRAEEIPAIYIHIWHIRICLTNDVALETAGFFTAEDAGPAAAPCVAAAFFRSCKPGAYVFGTRSTTLNPLTQDQGMITEGMWFT
jgi:hypothetical protein